MIIKPHITYQWLTWGVSRVRHGDLRPDVLARIDADRARARSLRAVMWTTPIPWVEDRSVRVRFIAHGNRLRDEWRRCAELTFNGRDVYLEWFGGTGGGPGFSFSEVRIHLDRKLVGRAWRLGCSLGGGGYDSPAVAMLRDDLALRVDTKMEHLELVRLTGPGVKAPRPSHIDEQASGRGRPPRAARARS